MLSAGRFWAGTCQTAGAAFGIDNAVTEAESYWVLRFSFWAPAVMGALLFTLLLQWFTAGATSLGLDLMDSTVAGTGQRFHLEQFGRT